MLRKTSCLENDLATQLRLLMATVSARSDSHSLEGEVAFEYDLVEGMSRPELVKLLARILLQAAHDMAECVTFKLNEGRITYTIKGREYEMERPPLPMIVDVARALARDSRRTSKRESELVIPLETGTQRLAIHLAEDDPWNIVVRGFSDK